LSVSMLGMRGGCKVADTTVRATDFRTCAKFSASSRG
jgi:hypothetical protein